MLVAAAGFVKGWLESRGIEVADHDHRGLPVLVADVGSRRPDAPCIVFHGHLDVVPGRPEQFEPRVQGDRLLGRGSYDMKGGLAAMLCALRDQLRQAESEAESAEEGSERRRVAERDKRRYEAFLRIAEPSS